MLEVTLKVCLKTHSLNLGRVWLNTKNKYWYTKYKGKPKAIHRILAEEFLSNPENLGDVHHIDGDRNNNELSNLQWCTRSANIWHSYNTHDREAAWLGKFNEDHHASVCVVGTSLDGSTSVEYPSIQEAGRQGFLVSKISLCINGKRKTHKGYTWKRNETLKEIHK